MLIMAVNKKRDFKRLSLCIQDFLKKLPCDENTGFLRDTLYLSLLELHNYYIKEKERLNLQQTNKDGPVFSHEWKDGQLDKYDERWKECDDNGEFARNIENLQENKLTDDHDLLGRTYLMHAIHGQHEKETVENILSLNFNINHQAHDGSTALHVASQYQKVPIAALLLKHKANASLKDKKGRTALHWAAKCHSSNMVKLLLQYNADVNVKDCDGMTPAMWACYFNRADNLLVLRNALERVDPRSEAILEEQDNMGRTVLHWAAMSFDQNNSLSCLKELLTLGDVSKMKDKDGRTVLHTAAIQGSVSACELILSSCEKEILNMKDNQEQTALHLATLSGHGEMVAFLLQNGANSSVLNSNKRTALQEAEIGHYHYCLLVFAAFEQTRNKKETRPPLVRSDINVEYQGKDRRKYESWVIPSTSLNESHEIPVDLAKDLTGEQLVDVTEIKGFEINEELDDEFIPNFPAPGKSNVLKEKPPSTKPKTSSDEHAVKNDKFSSKPDKTVATTAPAGRSNKPSLLQRSERVEESKDTKEESNFHESVMPNEGDDDVDLDGYSSQYLQEHDSGTQSESDDKSESEISENIEVSSLNIESEDEEVNDDKNKEEKTRTVETNPIKTETESNDDNRQTKGTLAPIKPLAQPSFHMHAKLDPIPLFQPNKKAPQSRGIVSPLQPPVQKEPPGLTRDKLQHHRAGPGFVARAPEHGPLAHAHSKELLSSVFKGNSSKTADQQKTPELQRRSMQPAKLSRPTVRH